MFAKASRGQRHRGLCARCGHDARAHQPSAIKHDPYRLAALGLVLTRDQISATRACSPADVAHVVAFPIVAQAFEIASQTALTRLAQLQVDLPAARQKYLLFFAGAQGRVDADGLGQRRHGPTFRESERRPIADVELAGGAIAAFLWFHAITKFAGTRGKAVT